MKYLSTLTQMRMEGCKPEAVFIEFDSDCLQPKYLQDFKNLCIEYGPCKDFRPFVGLDVILLAEKDKPEVYSTLENLRPYAKSVSVLVAEYAENIGFIWTKSGEIDLG